MRRHRSCPSGKRRNGRKPYVFDKDYKAKHPFCRGYSREYLTSIRQFVRLFVRFFRKQGILRILVFKDKVRKRAKIFRFQLFFVVRVAGFEPTASWSRTKRATNCATPGYLSEPPVPAPHQVNIATIAQKKWECKPCFKKIFFRFPWGPRDSAGQNPWESGKTVLRTGPVCGTLNGDQAEEGRDGSVRIERTHPLHRESIQTESKQNQPKTAEQPAGGRTGRPGKAKEW